MEGEGRGKRKREFDRKNKRWRDCEVNEYEMTRRKREDGGY